MSSKAGGSKAGWGRIAVGIAAVVGVVAGAIWAGSAALAAPATPRPTITSGPGDPTTSRTASFTYADSKSGASFRCALDSGDFHSCSTSGKTYTNLSLGSHTFRVEARAFSLGESSPASWTWTIVDPNGPPKPVITERADSTTRDTNPEFGYYDLQGNVHFLCSLDGGPQVHCTGDTDHDGDNFSNKHCNSDNDNENGDDRDGDDDGQGGRNGCSFGEIEYHHLSPGEHCFSVVAVDRAGTQSTPAEFCWTIKGKNNNQPFSISGNASSPFFPGAPAQPLDLVLTNPNNYDLRVTSITVGVQAGTTSPGGGPVPACNGTTNITVTRQFSGTVIVPANSTKSLTDLGAAASQFPLLQMPDLPVSQDACQGVTFHMSYAGTGVQA
ncbi:MAG TPA: hypothetical protein VFW71_00675 [Actinomycetota bacterium]|nr:hypothetical protein [Actinomycetota bacterium]